MDIILCISSFYILILDQESSLTFRNRVIVMFYGIELVADVFELVTSTKFITLIFLFSSL